MLRQKEGYNDITNTVKYSFGSFSFKLSEQRFVMIDFLLMPLPDVKEYKTYYSLEI